MSIDSARARRLGAAVLGTALATIAPGAGAAEEYVAGTGTAASASVSPSASGDVTRRTKQGSYRVVGGRAVVEGDMIIGEVDARGHLKATARGLGHSRKLGRWPDGIVPYAFGDGIAAAQRDTVLAAVRHWTENTRISFVERTAANAGEHSGWIVFRPTNGCASSVGRTDKQPQDLFVQSCTVGSVIHEIGHAVGLYHEHTRPDRDMWITVDNEQIIGDDPARGVRSKAHNFEIMRTNSVELGPYDYDSIMHYGTHFFAKGDKPTIIVPPGESIGQRLGLSPGDISAVNSMYATDLAVRAVTTDLGDAAEVDVTVDNIGELGAHDLEMVFELQGDAVWTAVTQNSGWDCLSDGPQLYCRRDTLTETAPQSRFILEARPNGASLDDLKVRLASRTLDTNPANNVVNDSVPTLGSAGPAADADTAERRTDADVPADDAGAPTASGRGVPTSSDGASQGAGGGVPALPGLAALTGLALLRRRRSAATR